MDKQAAKAAILSGETALGIEFGSTRIKAVLVDKQHTPLASGSFDWENRLEDGVWYWNPGSVSIPKENSWHACMRMTEDAVQWLDLDGNLKDELRGWEAGI